MARAADGSVRDGLSLLDQAIAQTGGHVDEQSVMDMLKRADRNVVVDLMDTILSGDTAKALEMVDTIYTNGADLTMLLSDMMEWTHWATRMHPVINSGDCLNSPYTADQREKTRSINSRVSLNTLSRIWQVMVAAVTEMQMAGNQKQCFDMLVVRMMHIADMPSVPEILKNNVTVKPVVQTEVPVEKPVNSAKKITTAKELGAAMQADKQILLYTYFSENVEVCEISDGRLNYFDRKGDNNFSHKLSAWLEQYTGKPWTIIHSKESCHVQTVIEHQQQELTSDPMMADALGLFAGAEIVDVSK